MRAPLVAGLGQTDAAPAATMQFLHQPARSGGRRFRRWSWRGASSALLLVVGSIPLGCASSTPLTKQARESVASVSVSREVSMPRDMMYIDQPGGGRRRGPAAQLADAMRDDSIDVREILIEEFTRGLNDARLFGAVLPEGGAAEFKLEVYMYGFVHAPFSTALKPVLNGEGDTHAQRRDPSVAARRQSLDVQWRHTSTPAR